jgi:hypothetical protein
MGDGNPEASRRNRKNNNTVFAAVVLLSIRKADNGLWTDLLLDVVEQAFLRCLWLLVRFQTKSHCE